MIKAICMAILLTVNIGAPIKYSEINHVWAIQQVIRYEAAHVFGYSSIQEIYDNAINV